MFSGGLSACVCVRARSTACRRLPIGRETPRFLLRSCLKGIRVSPKISVNVFPSGNSSYTLNFAAPRRPSQVLSI